MFSDDLLKRTFRYFILIVSLIVVVMGFLWLNFLYTRHQRSLEDLSKNLSEAIQHEVKDRAHLLRLHGDEIYSEERRNLEIDMENRGAILRAGLYDIFFDAGLKEEKREKEIIRILSNINPEGIYRIYLSLGDLNFGRAPEDLLYLSEGLNDRGAQLVYYDHLQSLDLEFTLDVDVESVIRKRMENSFRDFILWDKGMYLRNEEGKLILPLGESFVGQEGFSYEEFSEKTGFSFGYFADKTQLEERLEERRILFSSFLRNHIWEIAGFILIFILTSIVIYAMMIRRMGEYYQTLNEEILEAFRNQRLLSHNPKFQYFALGDSFDSILREAQAQKARDDKRNLQLEEQLKKNKLARLLLERKILRLSELPYTKAILHDYTVESFFPKTIIREIHRTIDPEAKIDIRGSDAPLNNDVRLFSALVEEIFQLTREKDRSYTVEIFQDGAQMLLYFSLYGLGLIEDEKMQELKNRAKLLDGVFLRHQMEVHTLHLVLSLNDVQK